MIILIIILAVILIFASWMAINNTVTRWIVGILSFCFLGGVIYSFTDHVLNHTGMELKTTKTTDEIYSAAGSKVPYGVLVHQEIGNDSGNHVLVYRDTKNGKVTAHFKPNFDNPKEMVKKTATYKYTNSDQATVVTTVKRYRWSSDFAKMMYGFMNEDGKLASRKAVAYVPHKTWLVVTQSQSKKLKQIGQQMKQEGIAKQKAMVKQKMKQAAGNPKAIAAITKAAKNHPTMSAEQTVTKLREALKDDSQN